MLRRFRQFLALAAFVALTLLLLGVVRWAWPARLQVVPALLALHVGALLFLVLLTLLSGRIYCSVLCPLGVLQDVVRRLSRRRRAMRYRRPWPGRVVGLVLLCVGVVGFMRGLYYIPALLDPFSQYGRLVGALGRPLWLVSKNALVPLNGTLGWWIERQPVPAPDGMTMAGAVALLCVLVAMAWLWGRAFCHWLCPVGHVLGWMGRWAPFGVRVDGAKCRRCGACECSCRSSCRRAADGYVDRQRCVVCLECVAVCPHGAVSYGLRWGRGRACPSGAGDEASSRRNFITSAGALLLSVPVARAQQALDEYERATKHVISEGDGFVTYRYENVRQVEGRSPDGEVVVRRTYGIMPPATVSRQRFQSRCTACGLCMTHCPSRILKPATNEYGPAGRMQPTADFTLGWCRPDCNRCAEVCPTDAIRLLPLAEKRTDRLGWATFNSRTCVAVTDGVDCDACVRHCSMNAIQMIEKEGHKVPTVIKRRCTGCGACEYYCPGRPLKAIYVEGLKY